MVYVYELPNESYWREILQAASKGRYYVFTIKPRFDYIRKYQGPGK